MKKYIYILLLLIAAFAASCKKELPGPIAGTDPDPTPVVKSSEKRITEDPVLPGLENVSVVKFNAATFTYSITVSAEVNVKSLRLNVKISPKATITPSPAALRDYSTPVTYTVTAEDGTTQQYIISITNLKDDIPTGPSCLVSRIENLETKEYFAFEYDGNGRVTKITEAVIYQPSGFSPRVTPWKALSCTYGSTGLLTEIRIEYISDFVSTWDDIIYRFTYSGGKLTTVNIKKGNDKPIAENVTVNANDQIIQWNSKDRSGYGDDICYAFTYSKGAITKSSYCGGNTIMAMTYGSVRHFLSAQAKYPALLFAFRDSAVQFDKTRLIPFHYGFLMPTEVDLPSGTGCTAAYTVNGNNFPTTMNIDYWWNLGTAFPEKQSFRYAVTYTNCN